MLAVSKYEPEYVEQCRERVSADLAAYDRIAGAANGALDGFESVFFNNMVLTLELQFVHRLRKAEGKDGNALNEVRILASSLVENGGVMLADKQITFKDGSLLGYAPAIRSRSARRTSAPSPTRSTRRSRRDACELSGGAHARAAHVVARALGPGQLALSGGDLGQRGQDLRRRRRGPARGAVDVQEHVLARGDERIVLVAHAARGRGAGACRHVPSSRVATEIRSPPWASPRWRMCVSTV